VNLGELIVEVYEALAEPSDLYPYTAGTTTLDMASAGALRLTSWINRAYKRIINWKFPNGQQVRFDCQEGEVFFQSMLLTGTVASATSTTAVLDTGVDAEADRYNGCLLEITGGTGEGQMRLIVATTAGRQVTVHEAWTTTPDDTSTYAVYKRSYRFRPSTATDADENIPLSAVNEIAAIRRLTDLADLSDLGLGGRTETYTSNLLTKGTPTDYIKQGSGVVFDMAPDSARWYRLEYVRIPPDLALAADEPDIPETFHEAVALYAIWWGLKRAQESGNAYATKRDIEDIMSSLKQNLEMAFEREDIGGEVY